MVLTVSEEFVREKIPARRKDSHKGMNGKVCIVGGSKFYHGAPFLSALGAMRTGVDLVYIAVPKEISTAVRSLSPDFIVIPLPDSKLTRGNVNKLHSWLPNVDCIAVGPGLGRQKNENLTYFFLTMKDKTRSFVVDADALHNSIIGKVRENTVVTPHQGEFERLFLTSVPSDLDARIKEVEKRAKDSNLTVLLKGYVDIISNGASTATNYNHTPAMTVGGTGDVLTGICASLLAKGLDAFDAACCAAYINGSAGLIAEREKGLHITASDVANSIPEAMRKYDRLS